MGITSKKLVLATGGYGVGTTTFAKWYAKGQKGVYLDTEFLSFGVDFATYLKRIVTTMESSSKKLFVVEGQWYSAVKDSLECNVQICLCFAAPHIVRARQLIKSPHVRDIVPLPLSEEAIKLHTYSLFNRIVTRETNPLFVDTTNGFQLVAKEDWVQRWEELIFYSNLDKMSHDKYYGDIELPSGISIKGYTQSCKSWERLQYLIDFRDKDVLDLGCFHGYFSFKAEESGARSVTGIDISRDVTKVARQIATLKNSRVRFCHSSVANFKHSHIYDIVLVLNVLHHIEDIRETLEGIYRIGKLVVFETPTNQREPILTYATQYGFNLAGRANSHRRGREILVLANSQANISISFQLPTQYRYNYRVAHLKRLPMEIIIKLVWKLERYYPFTWVMRKYRDRRELRRKILYTKGG